MIRFNKLKSKNPFLKIIYSIINLVISFLVGILNLFIGIGKWFYKILTKNYKYEFLYIAIISGVPKYTGARVNAPDLRAGAALVIAGLAADGVTIVDDIHYIMRGYENFEGKLRELGGNIELVRSEKELQKFILKVS